MSLVDHKASPCHESAGFSKQEHNGSYKFLRRDKSKEKSLLYKHLCAPSRVASNGLCLPAACLALKSGLLHFSSWAMQSNSDIEREDEERHPNPCIDIACSVSMQTFFSQMTWNLLSWRAHMISASDDHGSFVGSRDIIFKRA